jgi:hypothetical protein
MRTLFLIGGLACLSACTLSPTGVQPVVVQSAPAQDRVIMQAPQPVTVVPAYEDLNIEVPGVRIGPRYEHRDHYYDHRYDHGRYDRRDYRRHEYDGR